MPLKECSNKHLFNATKYGDVCPICKVKCTKPEDDVSREELEAQLRLADNQFVCAWLICTEGVNKGRSYALHTGKNFIGSGDDMDVQILCDNRIDEYRHGVLIFDSKRTAATMLPGESKGIIYVEDNAVYSPTGIESMAKITLGDTVLRYIPFCGEDFNWDS